MKNVFFAVAALLGGLSSVSAHAVINAMTHLDPIQVKGVTPGRAVSVFYVSGREGALGTVGQTLKLRSIKHGPVRVLTGVQREIRIRAVDIKTVGFEIPNFVVFVTHSAEQEAVYLRNSDGTVPEDPRLPGGDVSSLENEDFQYEKMQFISIIKLNRLKSINPLRDFIELDLDKDL